MKTKIQWFQCEIVNSFQQSGRERDRDRERNQSDLMFKQEHQELDSQCFMSNIIVIINNDYPPKSKMRKFSSNLITYNGCHSFITTDNEINQKKNRSTKSNRIKSNWWWDPTLWIVVVVSHKTKLTSLRCDWLDKYNERKPIHFSLIHHHHHHHQYILAIISLFGSEMIELQNG